MLATIAVAAIILYGIGLRADRIHAGRAVKEPVGHGPQVTGSQKKSRSASTPSGSVTPRLYSNHSAGYWNWRYRVAKRQSRNAVRYARKLERIIRASRHRAPTRRLSDSSVWDRLGSCESGYGGPANWSLNTGNGFFGGLQWLPSTWWAYGGHGMPDQASRAAQIAVAERVIAAAGGRFTDWPACRAKLGLP